MTKAGRLTYEDFEQGREDHRVIGDIETTMWRAGGVYYVQARSGGYCETARFERMIEARRFFDNAPSEIIEGKQL